MISATVIATLLLAVVPVSGFRTRHRRHREVSNSSSGAVGTVSELYTFGAPMVSKDVVANPASSSGCFSGYRVIREQTSGDKVDAVVVVLTPLNYNHPKMKVLRLNNESSDNIESCGWKVPSSSSRSPSVGLHDGGDYRTLSTAYTGAVASLALKESYNNDIGQVAAEARRQGWGLVETAFGYGTLSWLPIIGKAEVSHLFQNPNTLDCMITFEGSDSLANWLDNFNLFTRSFCGLPTGIHSGFQEAMRVITGGRDFQQKVRPKLKNCRNVKAVGHSLGGAIATLFSACANNYAKAGGDADFVNITWTKGTPTKMSYK